MNPGALYDTDKVSHHYNRSYQCANSPLGASTPYKLNPQAQKIRRKIFKICIKASIKTLYHDV